MPRNMFLFTNANYLLPYTGAGSGVRRALAYNPNVVFSNGVKDREITHTANEFVIIIPRNSNQATDNSNQVRRKSNQAADNSNQVQGKSNQATDNSNQVQDKSNQAADNNGNQVQGKSNQARTNLVTRKLTKKEEDIRNFCSVPRTAQEIMDRLKITNQSKNRQKYITALIDIGVLERTIPDRPNDPNQKYRRKR